MNKFVDYFMIGLVFPLDGDAEIQHYKDEYVDKIILVLPEDEIAGAKLLSIIYALTGSGEKFDIIAVGSVLKVAIDVDDLLPEFVSEME